MGKCLCVTPWSVSPVLVLVSTPSRCYPSSPLILWVFIPVFSVCLCQFVLFVKLTSVRPVSACIVPASSFLVLLVFDPAPDRSARPWACLLSCTFAPPLDYWPLPALTCRLPAPVVTINIVTSHSLHLGLTFIPDKSSHPLSWWQLCIPLAFSQPASWGSHLECISINRCAC